MDWLTILLAAGSGGFVGFALGLVGGGGSILAVPLLVYVVGVASPHVAIGTSAVAVAANAAAGLAGRARQGLVKWPCASLFAAAGVDGAMLLSLFALLMIVVGALMLRYRHAAGDAAVRLGHDNGAKIAGLGLGSGLLSGFFGIGGGFLIVPALMAATSMPIANAVASSLLAVAAFGTATAASYAASGLIDWPLAGVFILGGIAGVILGSRLSLALSARRGALNILFALLIFAVALYMLWQDTF